MSTYVIADPAPVAEDQWDAEAPHPSDEDCMGSVVTVDAGKLNGHRRVSAADGGNTRQPTWKPTHEDPISGLKHLGPIGLVSRDRILELAAEPVDYVWQDIAVAGTIVVIAGPPGEGKTTLLFLILVARITSGVPINLLGRDVCPAPFGMFFVLIEGEHSEPSTARKLMRSLRLLGVADSALENRVIIVARKAVELDSSAWLDVVQLIAAGLVSDIGVDTLARFAPAEANDEAEQVAIFARVAQAIEAAPNRETQPTCWIVAHTRKSSGPDLELSDIGGSVQRVGQTDTAIVAKATRVDGRVVSTKVSFLKLREEPEPGRYPLPQAFKIEGDLIRQEPASSKSPATDETKERDARILAVVLKKPGCSTNHILDHAGVGVERVKRGVTSLVERGEIHTTDGKNRVVHHWPGPGND